MSEENRIGHSRRSDKNQFQEIEDPSERGDEPTEKDLCPGEKISWFS
jgi:hypothetical protein